MDIIYLISTYGNNLSAGVAICLLLLSISIFCGKNELEHGRLLIIDLK